MATKPTAGATAKPMAKAKVAAKARPVAKAKVAAKPAAKAAAVPKKSPLAGTSVDAYVATAGHAEVINAVRAIIRKVAPTATETIKWAQPVFELNGPFAFIKAAKNHVTFGFWRGGDLADPEGVLEGDGVRMKHVKLKGPASIRAGVLAAFVKQAVELNRAKGNPTKR